MFMVQQSPRENYQPRWDWLCDLWNQILTTGDLVANLSSDLAFNADHFIQEDPPISQTLLKWWLQSAPSYHIRMHQTWMKHYLLCSYNCTIWIWHNNVHDWVWEGKWTMSLSAAVHDPIFNLHHCNVEGVWSKFCLPLLPAYVSVSGGHPGHNRDDYQVAFLPLVTAGGLFVMLTQHALTYNSDMS